MWLLNWALLFALFRHYYLLNKIVAPLVYHGGTQFIQK
jgi:hypothetical protein